MISVHYFGMPIILIFDVKIETLKYFLRVISSQFSFNLSWLVIVNVTYLNNYLKLQSQSTIVACFLRQLGPLIVIMVNVIGRLCYFIHQLFSELNYVFHRLCLIVIRCTLIISSGLHSLYCIVILKQVFNSKIFAFLSQL